MADISKVKLPSGNVYDIKDQTARDAIAALSGTVFFLGVTTTALTDGATTNPITIDGAPVTAANGNMAVYGNGEFIFNGTKWIEFGDLSSLGGLAYKDNVSLSKGSGDNVLGEATTFTNASSAVSFSGGTTDKVLGSDATFSTTVTPSTTTLGAVASGGGAAWNSKDQKTVLTGVKVTAQPTITLSTTDVDIAPLPGDPAPISYLKGVQIKQTTNTAVGASGTETFVKSYPGATQKLATTTVPNVTGNTDVSIPNVTSVGSADTWAFAMGSGTDAETLIISGANGTAPTLGTTLSASKVTLGTAKTVATGSLTSSGSGASVMTGLGTPTTASAVTGVAVTTQPSFEADELVHYLSASASGTAVGANGTANVIGASSTFTNTQPSIAIGHVGGPWSDDGFDVVTGITSAATTVNNKDEVTAVTSVGTATAAAQTITVGTNDKVKVAKYADLDVTVE